jgi:hypothetical protein
MAECHSGLNKHLQRLLRHYRYLFPPESGLAKSYTFTWSIANSSGVPPDLVRIAELALSGKW